VESSGSRVEVEIKLRFGSIEEALARLARLPSSPSEERRFERNDIYDTADGALARAGRLLRVRQVGDHGTLTFKEPVPGAAARAKVRAEIESGIDSPEALRTILEKTGFRVVYRYEKFRRYHAWRDGESGMSLAVSVDETPIGVFVELEGPQPAIDQAARRMGFRESDYILQDYRSLHAAWLRQRGLPDGDMRFDPPDTAT
jgi:adenylate cyclase class 2